MKLSQIRKFVSPLIISLASINASASDLFDCDNGIVINDPTISSTPVFGFLCTETIPNSNPLYTNDFAVLKIKYLDGSLYKKITFGDPNVQGYDGRIGKSISLVGDINGNRTQEVAVLIHERDGQYVTKIYHEIRDLKTGKLIKRVNL